MKRILIISLATLTVTAAASALAQDIPPGKWEIKTVVPLPATTAGGIMMKTDVSTRCIVAGKNAWSDQLGPGLQRNFTSTDRKVSANEVSWKLLSKDVTGTVKIRHNSKDAFTIDQTLEAEGVVRKITTEGKRLSATCDAK